MKKPIIALIVAFLAAGLSLGSFLVIRNNKNKEKEQEKKELADNVLFSFDPDSPDRITFTSGDQSYTAEKNGDEWKLDTDEFSLDQVYYQLICTYTSDLTAETNFGEITEDKLRMYGINEADKLEITEPKGTHTIYVGNESPTGEYVYVTVDGKNKIYAIDSTKGSVLRTDRLLMKNKDLIPYKLENISEFTTYRDGKVLCDLTCDTGSGTWSLPREYSSLTLDPTRVTSTLNAAIRLEAEEMLDEKLEDLSKYGFDKPWGEAVIKDVNGNERHILVALPETDDTTYCFVLVDGQQVERYYTADLQFTRSEPYYYIVQEYTVAALRDISGFDLSFNGSDDTCEVDISEKKCSYNGKDINLEAMELYSSFQNLYNSISIVKLAGTDTSSKPELKDPTLSAEFRLNDGGTAKLDFVEESDTRYNVFIDGKYIGAYTDDTAIRGRSSISEFCLKFKKLAGL